MSRTTGKAQTESIERSLEAVREKLPGGDVADAKAKILESGTDSFFTVESPLGTLYVAFGAGGVTLATPRPEAPSEFSRQYGEMFGRIVTPAGKSGERLKERVERLLAGERVSVPLDLTGKTDFQRRVLEVVSGIPAGEVRPYGWVASEAGNPRASRAVGTVMANNPVPLIVPCHRVVKGDGTPGNYGFDPERKVRLLTEEGVPLDELARAPYLATPTTGIVCHATCRNAKRIKPENRRRFRSIEAALESGFRPCKVCRPVVAA